MQCLVFQAIRDVQARKRATYESVENETTKKLHVVAWVTTSPPCLEMEGRNGHMQGRFGVGDGGDTLTAHYGGEPHFSGYPKTVVRFLV